MKSRGECGKRVIDRLFIIQSIYTLGYNADYLIYAPDASKICLFCFGIIGIVRGKNNIVAIVQAIFFNSLDYEPVIIDDSDYTIADIVPTGRDYLPAEHFGLIVNLGRH